MQNRSYLFLLVVVVLGVLSGALFALKAPKYGLDVRGGVRLTYQLDLSKLKPEERSRITDIGSRIVQILTNRAGQLGGATEANVQLKGTDQVIVEIPGATNVDEAEAIMGSSARMYMYHAKTVSTTEHKRRYEPVESSNPNDPSVSFQDAFTGKIVKPGDPEYQDIINSWGDAVLSGDDLEQAGSKPQGDSYVPTMKFSPSGAQKMGAWCDRYYNQGENLAYVLDNRVLNIAPLKNGAKITDEAFIEGKFTPDYVRNLADLLNAGSLPVDLIKLSSEHVDPTIGNQALGMIVTAGAIAFAVVSVFLIAYYSFPGIVAVLALSLYVLFTLTVLKWINASFSLAAIAGFILSVGMAVDANILVFERFKEEMKRGRTLHSAIELGFKRALPAIIDSNACTILTSLVLASLGTGLVKNFATTLMIGVAISLFTAVAVTRSLLVFFVDSGIATNEKWYAVQRNWFKKLEARADTDQPLQVVEKATKWFLISGATIVVFFFFIKGFKLNVEFQGGYEALYALTGPAQSSESYTANLEKSGLKGGNVKFASYTTQPATLTFTEPSKITLDPKVQKSANDLVASAHVDPTLAKILAALDIDPAAIQTPSTSANQVQFTVGLDDLKVSNRTDAVQKINKANLGKYEWTFGPEFTRNVAYVTVPPNRDIAAIVAPQHPRPDHDRAVFVAEKAGLTNARERGFTEVGPVVQKETIQNAFLAVIFSSVLIIVYLAMRFGFSLGGFIPGLRFGASAILALIHDILVVIGSAGFVGAIFGWEISALFVTAMLTVIGFSVHDTIVIFDRIRENLRRPEKGHDLGFVMDKSITQSFARSLNTSMTVVATLIILIVFGTATPDLKFFCVAMLVGIVSGTYSSIYNASPILYLWDKAITRKDPKKGLIGLALEEQAKLRLMQTQVRAAQGPQVQSEDTGRSYGQVRRRASAEQKGHVEIEDEP